FDGNADFSGMTGDRSLCIDIVLHKAFVAVDEKGTEAAAATAVVMKEMAMMPSDLRLVIDRPFLFVIRDSSSGQILFVGRVLNPAG
ncbi:MAG TPA: serpin family protein, partial [Anaerolineales bacterium]|nr:serpin family protein [Anaerolineales bacterium]